MTKGAKTISRSWRREIDIIKNNILMTSKPFDGTGYPFKQAVSELRKEGLKIEYNREIASYVKL